MYRAKLTRAGSSAHRTLACAIALAALSTVIAVIPAHAQDRISKSLGITAFGGYYIASDLYQDHALSNSQLELSNTFEWGGRATAFTNRFTALEFGYTRVGSDLKLHGGSISPAGYRAGRVNGDEFDFNFLISSPSQDPKFWPYFTFGLGWTNTHPELGSPPSGFAGAPITTSGKSLFAWNFGLGSFINLNPKLSLRLDARWRLTDTNVTTSSGVYCDYYGYCWNYASSTYSSGDLTAGLTYRFKH